MKMYSITALFKTRSKVGPINSVSLSSHGAMAVQT